jgi:hypothetical protein
LDHVQRSRLFGSQSRDTLLSMRRWLKAYFGFLSSAWQEFERSTAYTSIKITWRVVWFIASVIGLVGVLKYGFSLASKRAWTIVALSIVIAFLFYVIDLLRRFHARTVREQGGKHQSELKELKGREKGLRFQLFRRNRKRLNGLKEELADVREERVSIDYFAGQPSFLALKSVGRKSYRVFRVRVTNIGDATLYHLRAQLRLSDQHTSYENEDLTLKEEGLPIIQRILYRHEQDVLPRPRTSFTLTRGEGQFVDVAMQENENGKWAAVTLCLSRIGVDNYSNIVYPKVPIEFNIVVLGDMTPCSKKLVLFLDDNDVAQMKEAEVSLSVD